MLRRFPLLFALLALHLWAQAPLSLGRLANGATVSFVRSAAGEWGLEIAGGSAPRLVSQQPVRLEVFAKEDDVRQLGAGYRTVAAGKGEVTASAELTYGSGVTFRVEDRWSVTAAALSVHRKVAVTGNVPGGGFYSALMLSTGPQVTWPDLDYLAPGIIYGDPAYDGERSVGGTLNYAARRFMIREDLLAAPMFAVSFRNGASAAVLNTAPRGDTTLAEASSQPGSVIIDERLQFGALGARQAADGGVEFGFWLPGTTYDFAGGRRPDPRKPAEPGTHAWRRRYHPVRDGFAQTYQLAFRLGQDESFPDVIKGTYRWAWQTLKPAVTYMDIELVRRTLLDHLADQVLTMDGRTGLPFYVDVQTGKVGPDPFEKADPVGASTRAIMGFVGKNIEGADQLLREAERDPSPRGQRMRKLGLAIIDTFIRIVPMSKPVASGFNLKTGELSYNAIVRMEDWFLRGPTEDMRMLMEAYRREKKLGRDHPDWLRWAQQLGDWVLSIQATDGSYPRGFKGFTGEVTDPSGTTSYNPVPLLLMLSEDTGNPRYRESALRAAEYVWASYGTKGLFIGGAIDNPNITDKEAGMLAMEAFLMLYESTRDEKWLKRAQVAGDFAESWIWIWNVPMPVDASDTAVAGYWRKGVPTVGLQGITAQATGGVDYYLEWSLPAYVKLYKYTKDEHYLDVARILLHNTHAMLALPGRTFDMLGPGWQHEHWSMGPGRGRGLSGYRYWLPWVSTNQLYGITGLEALDPALFKQLSAKPAAAGK